MRITLFLYYRLPLFTALYLLSLGTSAQTNTLRIGRLKAETVILNNEEVVQFSWTLESEARAVIQTAFEIQVASDSNNLKRGTIDTWYCPKTLSARQSGIACCENKLRPGTKYYWRVRVWDGTNRPSPWSTTHSFLTGIGPGTNQKGKWITAPTGMDSSLPLFRKIFSSQKTIHSAVISISGPGYFELYLNGKKVGDQVLQPAQTNYESYALYNTHDVTTYLQSGQNVLGVMLGNGWFNQDKVWQKRGYSYGLPMLYAELRIKYIDGSDQLVVSDESWTCRAGPIIKSNIYEGEYYDARKEIPFWSKVALTNNNWQKVVQADKSPPALRPQIIPSERRIQELKPVGIRQIAKDRYIFDFGQNFSGWIRLRIAGQRGQTIMMRFSEELGRDSLLDMSSTGSFVTGVEQSMAYTCKGDKTEIWEPRFSYHGFRYVEIKGKVKPAQLKTLLTGIVVHNDLEMAGDFICSDEQINRLHNMAKWTLRSNLHGLPTDCPTREKCGWLGDAHAITPMSVYNYDMEAFWIKYLHDIRSSSKAVVTSKFNNKNTAVASRTGLKPGGIPFMIAPGKRTGGIASIDWGTAIVQIPWFLYMYYGNTDVLREFYPDMQQWVQYCRDSLVHNNIVYEGLGDWCPPTGRIDCPVPLSSTAFHYRDLDLMTRIAATLQLPNDQNLYDSLRTAVKSAFYRNFYKESKGTFGSITANALALDFGLSNEVNINVLSDSISSYINKEKSTFLNVGIFGLSRVFQSLAQGQNEKAIYEVLTKKGFNSFAHMWDHYGATTLWEVLPTGGYYESGNQWAPKQSHNHPMQGGFDSWFYEGILGITPDFREPGFKKIVLRPRLTGQLAWARGSYHSIHGIIRSAWRNEVDAFSWAITIPPNSSAKLIFPANRGKMIYENGKPMDSSTVLKYTGDSHGGFVVEVPSGNYHFEIR